MYFGHSIREEIVILKKYVMLMGFNGSICGRNEVEFKTKDIMVREWTQMDVQ